MSESPQPITLTDKAAGKIKELLGEQETGSEQALRVPVRGGGCSGFQYALAFDAPKEGDHRFETDGVAVVVDKTSMQFVFGSEVDWVDGLQGAGFSVNNPNVVAACGCGQSTELMPTPAGIEDVMRSVPSGARRPSEGGRSPPPRFKRDLDKIERGKS